VIRLVRAEFLKLRTTQVWFWLLLGTIAVGALLAVAAVAPQDGIRTQKEVPDLFASFGFSPGYIVVFVLGVLGVTTEFRYQTITPTVLQTPSRWAIVTAKMITYSITGAVFALFALLAEAAVGIPWLHTKDVSVHFSHSNVQHAIVATFGVVALYGIIGLGVGALLRNQIVAVVVGIIFLLVLENIVLAIPVVKHVWPYTPEGAKLAVLYTNGDRTVNDVAFLGTGAGVVVLLLWAFVPAIVGAAYSMNRDIT
jgi:ABC-2 type transport system permease protein